MNFHATAARPMRVLAFYDLSMRRDVGSAVGELCHLIRVIVRVSYDAR